MYLSLTADRTENTEESVENLVPQTSSRTLFTRAFRPTSYSQSRLDTFGLKLRGVNIASQLEYNECLEREPHKLAFLAKTGSAGELKTKAEEELIHLENGGEFNFELSKGGFRKGTVTARGSVLNLKVLIDSSSPKFSFEVYWDKKSFSEGRPSQTYITNSFQIKSKTKTSFIYFRFSVLVRQIGVISISVTDDVGKKKIGNIFQQFKDEFGFGSLYEISHYRPNSKAKERIEKLIKMKENQRHSDFVVRNKWDTKKFTITTRVKTLAINEKEFNSKQQRVLQNREEIGKMNHLRKELLTKKHDIKQQFVFGSY